MLLPVAMRCFQNVKKRNHKILKKVWISVLIRCKIRREERKNKMKISETIDISFYEQTCKE